MSNDFSEYGEIVTYVGTAIDGIGFASPPPVDVIAPIGGAIAGGGAMTWISGKIMDKFHQYVAGEPCKK